jgi:hypothetical protein
MSVILSLLGIVLAAVGIAAIGFGIPINEFTLGTTLIVAGVSALTGGLILIGLAAVVAELGRLAEAVRTRIAARPAARPAEEPAASTTAVLPAPVVAVGARSPQTAFPRPRAEAPVSEVRPHEPAAGLPEADVVASAAERLRASIPRAERPTAEPSIFAHDEEVPLSPNGAAHVQPRPPRVEAAPPEPKVSADDRGGGAAVEALKASRLDFLFRSKPARPLSQRENFDAAGPADARAGKRAESEPAPPVEGDERQAEQAVSVQDRRPEPAPLEEPRGTATVLKSGVVDGMAYTLYTDGSIEAKLPDGTVRFGSIAELRAHIERNS